jgi:hypothetical protein
VSGKRVRKWAMNYGAERRGTDPNKWVVVHRVMRTIFNGVRRAFRGGCGTEVCCRCGKEHGNVWLVSDDIWGVVFETQYGVFCIDCFDKLFRAMSVEGPPQYLFWRGDDR